MLVDTAANEFGGDFSPDGRFFTFDTNETGQYEVKVGEVSAGRTFSVSTSTRGGTDPRWSRDGREIYYLAETGGPGLLVAGVDVEAFSASEPREISDIATRRRSKFDVTEDGQRFLVTLVGRFSDVPDAAAATRRIIVILNWFEELKQRVPTGR